MTSSLTHLPPPDLAPDAELVAAALAGDGRAQRLLYERHAPAIARLARRLCADREDARDLVQDAFERAFSALHTLREPQCFGPWVAGTVFRMGYRIARRTRRLHRLTFEMALEATRPVPTPDLHYELRGVSQMVAKLPAKRRTALLLRRVDEMALAEIAESMQASVSSVKRWIAGGERALLKAVA